MPRVVPGCVTWMPVSCSVGVDLGETEVEDLGRALAGDRNVGGLQVTVDDALGVRGGQSGGDLTDEPDDIVDSHGPARETFLQRLAVIERHGDEQLASPLADLVDRGDVRMVERAGGLCFSNEAQLRHRVICRAGRQELQRNITIE